MSHHPNTTPASPFLASPHFDASFDSIESLTTSFETSAIPTLETTTVTEAALGYHRNQQYSITAMTTSTGAVAERYAYTAYGQPTILNASGSVLTSSAFGNRYTYTGREWDETLGLHHFRARWMNPLAGRFLGRDPIGFKGSRQGQYSSVEHKPHVRLDPTGLISARGELFVGKLAYTFPSDPFANTTIAASSWLNGVSNDGCRFDSPSVGDTSKPTQIGWSRFGLNFQSEESRSGPSTFLVSAKPECCCPDDKIECATFYVHMVSTLGVGVEITTVGGNITVTAGLQMEVFDYYFILMICADGSAHSGSVFVRNTDLSDSDFYVGHDLTAGSIQQRHTSYIPGQHGLGADFLRDLAVGFYISDNGPCILNKIHTLLPRGTTNGTNLPWGPVE